MAFVLVVMMTTSPILLVVLFFLISAETLKKHQAKIGTLYNNLRVHVNEKVERASLMQIPIFMVRRLAIVVLAAFMSDWPAAQIQLTLLISILTIIYLIL